MPHRVTDAGLADPPDAKRRTASAHLVQERCPLVAASSLTLAGDHQAQHPLPGQRPVGEHPGRLGTTLADHDPSPQSAPWWNARRSGSPGRRPRCWEWATAECRQAGFEPDDRYTTTDLQIHLRLVERGLAAALLPDLAGARDRHGVVTHPLPSRPRRQIFTTVRRGATRQPKIQAFTTALKTQETPPRPERS